MKLTIRNHKCWIYLLNSYIHGLSSPFKGDRLRLESRHTHLIRAYIIHSRLRGMWPSLFDDITDASGHHVHCAHATIKVDQCT